LLRKCPENVSKSALIDQFLAKTAPLRDSTKNGSCKKTLYTCFQYVAVAPRAMAPRATAKTLIALEKAQNPSIEWIKAGA
jgi:hypothetical protein